MWCGWRLGSGHLASFDRRKCKGPLNGPKATGQHCPEGWTLYPTPGPNFRNVKDSGSADSHYYDWVDQFDTLGLGKNTPIITGNSSDSLLALVNGKFVILRVPYPLGFFAKGNGRPHRRSECRLERERPLDDLGHSHAVPQRNRQGNHQQSSSFPNPAESVGELGEELRQP